MRKKIAVYIFLALGIGIITFNLIDFKEYELTEYDKELISYFEEVVLNTEYDDNPKKVLKWTEKMNLFIIKDENLDSQVSIIKNTIDKINNLIKDDFKIQLVDKPSEMNSVIFLLDKEKTKILVPSFFDGIDEDFIGLADVEYDTETFEIKVVKIFIDINEPIELQEATILEEITQSIGIMNDSETYPNSIFYKNKHLDTIRKTDYSKLDKDIIRMLYNPKMKPGLNFEQAEKVIKEILEDK